MIRKRKYHLAEVLGIDQYNLRSLRALKTKLVRDYLGFFGTLSGLYQGTKQKKEINSSVIKVNQTIALIDSILVGEVIGKKDIDQLLLLIDDINADKDHFLQKASEVRAFSSRISKVTEETGISIEDLNITKDIVSRVGIQTRKAQREGAAPFLRKTMPGMFRLGRGVTKGIGTALVGPFAPLLGPIVEGMFGLGGALVRGVQKRRQVGLAERLRPAAAGISPTVGREIFRARGQEPTIGRGLLGARGQEPTIRREYPRVRGQGLVARGRGFLKARGEELAAGGRRTRENLVKPLMYFFNKKAYRAKWTRELLKKITNLEGGKGGLGGLFRGFLDKLKYILPVALGGAAVGAAGLVAYKATKAYTDWTNSLADQYGALERQIDAIKNLTDYLKDRIIETQEDWRKVRKTTRVLEEHRVRIENISKYQVPLKDLKRSPFRIVMPETPSSPGTIVIPKEARMTTPAPSIPRREGMRGEELRDILRETEKRGIELQKSIDRLSGSIEKEKSVPNIRNRGYGDPYDSADTLLGMRASGNLTIGGE